MRAVFLIQVGATLFMFGVIMVIQVVHYPLFAKVGPEAFARYEASHTRLITWVVLLPMLLELITSVALALHRPTFIAPWEAYLGLALVGILWLSTFLLQVPLHGQLTHGFDLQTIDRLVATNWIRTLVWGVRSGLVIWWLARVLPFDLLQG